MAWFGYSTSNPGTCTTSFGTSVPATDLGSGTSVVAIYADAHRTDAGHHLLCLRHRLQHLWDVGIDGDRDLVHDASGGTPGFDRGRNAADGDDGDPEWLGQSGRRNDDRLVRVQRDEPRTCTNSFGTAAPPTGGTNLGAGTTVQTFSQTISGLTPGTTYYFCALATSSVATGYGTIASFTTPELPVATTSAASLVTNTTATLNGAGTPDGVAATGWFEYGTTNPGTCNTTFGTQAPATGGSALGTGGSAVTYAQAITGLAPLTTYYFCAFVSSTAGVGYGSVLSFTTGAAPAVTTTAATTITATAATLNGSAVANGADTTGWFEYSTTNPGACSTSFGTRAPATGGTDLGTGSSGIPYTQSISGLSPGTTYFFCAIASNAYGTSTGTVLSFTTSVNAPVVATVDAIPLSGTTAQLDGSAKSRRRRHDRLVPLRHHVSGALQRHVRHAHPRDRRHGPRRGDNVAILHGDALRPHAGHDLLRLRHRLERERHGVRRGPPFTAPFAPTVVTSAATSVTNTAAALNGGVNPNGVATTGWFRYDVTNPGICTDAFGTRVPASGGVSIGSGTAQSALLEPISNLAPATTYYFCALASSVGGESVGTVLSFTTPTAPTVTTGAPTLVTATTATLNGSANPNGADASGWFGSRHQSGNLHEHLRDARASERRHGSRLRHQQRSVHAGDHRAHAGHDLLCLRQRFNTYGTSTGSVVSFTTSAGAPAVSTVGGTPLTATTAQLNGSANPDGAAHDRRV